MVTGFRLKLLATSVILTSFAAVPLQEGSHGSVSATRMASSHLHRNPSLSNRGIALEAVSCASRMMCMAIASYSGGLFFERWSSNRWTFSGSPEPAGVTDTAWSAVSCGTPTFCMATGTTDTAKGVLVEWNGRGWRQLAVPDPSLYVYLDDLTCLSARFCAAAGEAVGRANGRPIALEWNGAKWRMSNFSDPVTTYRSGIACVSPSLCFAIQEEGMATSPYYSHIWRWNGRGWAPEAAPHLGTLNAVSCSTDGACEAVGSGAKEGMLIESWMGSRWSGSLYSSRHSTELVGVACGSKQDCVAVGQQSIAPFAMHWDGMHWAATKIPGGGARGYLASVSCVYPGSCTAVGDHEAADGLTTGGLAVQWSGAMWRRISSPQPASLTPRPPRSLSANALADGMRLTWAAPSGGTDPVAYAVESDPPCPGCLGLVVSGSSRPRTNTTVLGLTDGTTYTFRVITIGAVAKSAPSEASAAVTPNPEIAIDPETLPVAEEGQPYAATIHADGGAEPYHWTSPEIPGLTITTSSTDPKVAILSGTPTDVARYTFDIEVTDSAEPTPHKFVQAFELDVGVSGEPSVTSVSDVSTDADPTISISGYNFGASFPVVGSASTSQYLEIFDCGDVSGACDSSNQIWSAGYTGDLCDVTVLSWTNTDIEAQLDNDFGCFVSGGDDIGVSVYNTEMGEGPSTGTSRGVLAMEGGGTGDVWGYCFNLSVGLLAEKLANLQGWVCLAGSDPSDVAVLVGEDTSPLSTADISKLGNLIEAVSDTIDCTVGCAQLGVAALGTDASSTSAFAAERTSMVGFSASVSIADGDGEVSAVLSPLSLSADVGASALSGDGFYGVLYGYGLGVCALCVDTADWPGLTLGEGSLGWRVIHIGSQQSEAFYALLSSVQSEFLQACRNAAIVTPAIAACPMAVAPFIGEDPGALESFYEFMSGIYDYPI